MSLFEPQNTTHPIWIMGLIQRRTWDGVGCIICPGPRGESSDILKAGCFPSGALTQQIIQGNANERTWKWPWVLQFILVSCELIARLIENIRSRVTDVLIIKQKTLTTWLYIETHQDGKISTGQRGKVPWIFCKVFIFSFEVSSQWGYIFKYKLGQKFHQIIYHRADLFAALQGQQV